MKLLFVTEFFPKDNNLIFTGGVEAYNFFLIRELAKKNKVIVICQDLGGSDEIYIKNLKVIRVKSLTTRIDTGFLTIPSRLVFLLNVIRRGLDLEFDIVQGNNFVTHPAAFLIGLLKNKPTVAWYPDVFIGRWVKLTGFLSGIFGEITERISLNLSWNAIISLSKSTEKKIIDKRINKEIITTIYAGVDKDYFDSVTVKKQSTFTITLIARLVEYKRVDLLIQAAKILKSKDLIFKIQIIGDGPLRSSLNKLIKRLNLEDRIEIESNLSRNTLVRKLKSSHLFCLPSEEEGFGMVVLEAAACKIPYLVTNIPALKEITRNGTGGALFRKGSIKDLTFKLEKFIRYERFRKDCANDAYQLSKLYSWQNIANQFEQVYKKVLPKIKVLMVIDAWFPHIGGGQVLAWELSKRLKTLGCQITIITRNLGNWQNEDIKVIKVGHFKKFGNIIGRIEFLLLAFIYSLKINYDLIHLYAFSPGLMAPFLKVFKSQPIVFHILGEGLKISGLSFGSNFLQKVIFYKIPYDLEITVSKNVIREAVAAKKLIFISNGVDINKFTQAQRERNRIRKIFCISRLFYDKGVDILVTAFNQLNSDAKLIVVGDGPEEEKIKKIAGRNIDFRGSLYGQDYIDALKEADLLVIPSRTEGLPLRLLEAWSAKLPVLATRVGDVPRYVVDGKDGFLAEATVESIKKNLERVLAIKNLNKVTDVGFKKVQLYDWDNIAEKIYKEYKGVINA